MDTQSNYKMIGLMSGTSGDGLDMVYCEFQLSDHWTFKILQSETVPFPPSLEESLSLAHRFAGEELAYLDILFGRWMGQHVREFCAAHRLAPDAIASHGHTVFHQPERGLTLQIGNGWALRQSSGLPVINDFRSLDVMLGGQGAPLVPIGDHHLFGEYDFCLNLGGISNISIASGEGRIAFDISPFNLLLNHYANLRGLRYDDQGKLAASGTVVSELLEELENLPLHHQDQRKSLGREEVDGAYLPLLKRYPASPENMLATLTAHFSSQISKVILAHAKAGPATLLVTGGGAYNRYFIDRLSQQCGDNLQIILPEHEIIDFKEALVFAFLGVLRLRKENNCMRSVTGASRDNCGGILFE
jgi:anhydro-N-acetylmuramic acid kinase